MSSSTEIWRHLPLLFQRSCQSFGSTCPVIAQLRTSAKKLTSLRLVGVEGTINVQALSEALQHNTTLQHVSICGTFLQTLAMTEHGIEQVFHAIGSLPYLNKLTLQGNEDSEAFPVEALVALLERNSEIGGRLEEISCHYVDLVASTPTAMDEVGQALKGCKSLKRIQLLSLHLKHITSLDPIVSSLSHCEEVEIGLRHRRQEVILSASALQTLLAPTSRLQKLSLKRRITIGGDSITAILQSLMASSSNLKELQLDEVNLSSSTTATAKIWSDLATVLDSNNKLHTLDLTFVSSTSVMDHQSVVAVTRALSANKSLKRLCLLGAMDDNMDAETGRLWVDMLEQYNFTLEELELQQQPSSTGHSNNFHQKLEHYLQLNRQPVFRLDGTTVGGLRNVMRDYNGAIPQYLMLPCLEAALRHDADNDSSEKQELSPHCWSVDDAYDNQLWETLHTNDETTTTTTGVNGLYYLLSQQPSLILAIQQKLDAWQVECQRREEQRQAEQAAYEEARKGSIPIGGASPQLILLDDDIVALW